MVGVAMIDQSAVFDCVYHEMREGRGTTEGRGMREGRGIREG